MSLSKLHQPEKPVSAKTFFKGTNGSALSIQIKEGGLLDKHTTPIPALLLCISGTVEYQDENGNSSTLNSGDYQKITPEVEHWVKGVSESQLVLIK